MASYQARHRDPFLDSNTQAILEQRGKELFGVTLIVLAALVAMILGSYYPGDPSWLSATDEPARNLLGRLGASIASPLIVIAGFGAWGIAIILATWGARFMWHTGEERAIGRVIFAPIAVALASVYASTHLPGANWTHSFGLGGLFGDTVLGAILGVVPVQATLGLKILAFFMAIGTAAVAAFVLGFTTGELRRIARFLLFGIVITYAGLLRLLGLGARGVMVGAQFAHTRHAARKEQKRLEREEAAAVRRIPEPSFAQPVVRRATATDAPTKPVLRAEPTVNTLVTHTDPQKDAKPGMFAKIPAFLKRSHLPEADFEPTSFTSEDFGDPEIKARISQIIQDRLSQPPSSAGDSARAEPQLQAHNQHGALPMLLHADQNLAFATEPPNFAHHGSDDPSPMPATPLFETEADNATYQPSQAPVPDAKNVVQHPPRRAVHPSRQARTEAQPDLQFEDVAPRYELPPLSLLANPVAVERHHLSDEALEENARMLESVLDDYGVKGEIVSVRPGPVVTMYELEPAPGLKASRVIGLSDDIARSMSALSARVSTVPGRSVIGIELPNVHREKVILREILGARNFGDCNMKLPLALGKDIAGDPVIVNLSKMPHLLIAGTTGSGKSVAINTMILSLLYKLSPEDCRLIMIDPKMLELSAYDGIPHLLSPVVTDPKKAVVALKWVVGEMEDRYRKMSKMGVRNIEGFNGKVRDALARG